MSTAGDSKATTGVALVSLLSAYRDVAPAADPLAESDARFNRLLPPREFVPLFVLNGGSVAYCGVPLCV